MKQLTILIALMMIFGACKQEQHKPLVGGDGQPGLIKNVKVENTPGGAKISYALPEDSDLLYVTAFFSSKDGEVRSVKSSLYKNFVEVEGFSDTKEYEVTLYAINKAEVKSDPVKVKIKPLLSPMQILYNSLQVREDFGGVNLKFENELGQDFTITTLIKDENGKWVRLDKLFTKAKSLSHSVRGVTSEEHEFAFYITDKYTNTSDTLVKKLTPLYEERLDKKLWAKGNLPSDFNIERYRTHMYPRGMDKLWDDDHSMYSYFQQDQAVAPPLPHYFSIDLGKIMKLSRMKIHQWEGGTSAYAYLSANPSVFEIWGSSVKVDDMSQWTKLIECESIKPSGLPYGTRSAEDVAFALAGEDFTFPLDAPPVRYIRFVLKKTWANVNFVLFDELTLWGQDPTKKP